MSNMRNAAEMLAEFERRHPGDYGVIAPQYHIGRDELVEDNLLPVLGDGISDKGWNRALGEIHLISGSRFYLDSYDDGAQRIQGRSLCGVWIHEVPELSGRKGWRENVHFAVRRNPFVRIFTDLDTQPKLSFLGGAPKLSGGAKTIREMVNPQDLIAGLLEIALNSEDPNARLEAIKELWRRGWGEAPTFAKV